MEEDHSFLFLKKNLMKIFFFEGIGNFDWWIFLKELKIFINEFFIFIFFKELKILIDDFFVDNLRSMSPMPLVPRLFWKFSLFFSFLPLVFFFFFWKTYPLNETYFKLEVDADCWISPCLIPNAPSLGHIPCLDWSWIHLMLWPLGNMKEDHGPPSLIPAKMLYFSNLLETNYHENLHTI